MSEIGKVFLVGAGPGEPKLSTLRAKELIEQCDVLVYDNLANPELRKWTKADCIEIDVGKSPGRHTVDQRDIEQTLVEHASLGKMVVRLKGGDPFVFGRCAEEMLALDEAGISYEIVPGVTAALACAGYAGLPLSHRECGSTISFLTGHEDLTKETLRVDFSKFAKVGGTLCIYMGMSKLEEIVEKLLEGGIASEIPAAVVSNGTLPSQRKIISPLKNLVNSTKEAGLEAPAIVFIGNAIGRTGEKANWFESRPLFGRSIVLTRSVGQVSTFKEKLEILGAEVMELPLIKILPSEDKRLIAEIFAGIATYEWVVFTSVNGAREFMRLFFLAFGDIRSFGPMRLACVGEGTAKVFRDHFLEVELIPEISTAENLAKDLVASDSLDSANVLVVTGNRNREVLVQMLEDVGHAIVDTLQVYETDFEDVTNAPDFKKYCRHGADAIIFSSSSTALSYVEQEQDIKFDRGARKAIHCSFGPETSKTLRENQLSVDLECEHPSMDNMIQKLLEYFPDKS
jgi:uroporphyrinogen III methyltransferase/synthase